MVDKIVATEEYFKSLYEIKSKMNNKTYFEKNSIWITEYENIVSKGIIIKDLPKLLSLIYPDFYFNGKGEDLSKLIKWNRTSKFSSDITDTNICMWGHGIGKKCIFNSDIMIRGKCQADHYWPNYLGGPSIKENRVILCKYHNSMKGSDIYNYNWECIPSWLVNYLRAIYDLKR